MSKGSAVIAYTYQGDVHCIDCTQRRNDAGGFTVPRNEGHDEHGIPLAAHDGEGNLVGVILSLDETPDDGLTCGDCFDEIEEESADA